MKKVIMMLLGIAFAGAVWAHPSVVIERPAADEIFLADPLSGFCLPLQLGASDADLTNRVGFAVKVTCGANTLYDKPDILFQKGYPTSLEINEGYSSLPVNVTQTGTITVRTPDGRVTTGTFQFIISAAKYAISYDGNGATGTMKNDIFSINTFVTLSANKFSALGYTFAGWTKDGETVIYGDRARDTNFADPGETRKLWAKWNLNTSGVTATSYSDLVAKVNQAGKQAWNLPVTIGFTSGVKLNGATVTLPSDSGFDGFKYKGDAEVGSDLYVKDGVLYGSKILGEVTVDALQLMQLAMGGSIGEFKAESENIVMLLGNDGKAYLNDDDDVDQMIADILAANPRPTTVKLYKEKGFIVSYDGNGAAGEMPKDMFMLGEEVSLSTNAFSAVGYTFAGWTTNGVDEVAYNDGATITDLDNTSSPLELTAKWKDVGVSLNDFVVLTNTLVVATNQAASLPVKITLTGEIAVPQDGVITVNASPAITFAGEGMLDVSAIVPTFGTPSVVGEGFTSTNAPAFFDTKGISKLVYEGGTISLVARGESEEFPWILDATTNVTAWVESSNLVIDNGLTAESYDVDLVALTNNFATYSYTPASPLNAVVKVGAADYKTPTCWIGESDFYATLGAALEAGETTVLPGYEVVYEANGAAGSMTNSYFAAATEATLTATGFSAVGYDFEGWTLGTNTTVIADAATVKDLASVDGSATLTAQWSLNADGVTEVSFEALTNTIATAGLQKTNLPITIDFTSEVVIPEGAVLSAFPSGTGFSGIRYVPEEEGYSTLSVSNGVLYASTVREEVTVDALVLMQHAMGGSIPEFKALTTDEDGATIATNIVMFVGDNHKAYFNDGDDVDQMIADVLAADPRPTTVKLYEVKGAIVTFEAMGGLIEAGVDPLGNAYEGGVENTTYLCMPDTGYQLPEVTREDYTLIGWYDGWTNGVNAVTNHQEIVNYSEHSLYAKWQSTKIHPSETPGEKIIETKEGEDGTIVRPSKDEIAKLPEELILPETDTGAADGNPLTKIDEKAYAGLKTITKVALPIYVSEIGSRAFYNEKNLGEVTFVQPLDYATLEKVPLTIGDYAFFGSKIEKVTIPSTTSKLGTAAFANCANLREVTILGELTIDGQYPFRNCGSAEDRLTITLSPRAAVNQDFINSLTNGCLNVEINTKYAGEISTTGFVPNSPEAGKVEISFTYSANDVDINVDTVTAVYAASLKEVSANTPMIPLEVRANGSNSYTAVFTMPEGSRGFYRLTVNIEK